MHNIFQDFYKVAFDSLSDIAFVFTLVGVYISENIDFNNESNGEFKFHNVYKHTESIMARFLNEFMGQMDILLHTNDVLLLGSIAQMNMLTIFVNWMTSLSTLYIYTRIQQ